MKNKITNLYEVENMIHDNMTIMIGGFASVGEPKILIDAVIDSGAKNLTCISCDAGYPGTGMCRLLRTKQIKKLIASHIGANTEIGKQLNAGELTVELVPQGTLAERIRCGGAGLGGALTPTGIGTEVEEDKQKLLIEGREYLLELPLRADIALIRGSVVDKDGNIYYKATTSNFNPVMATAADVVIVAAERVVEVGKIQPECVATPGIFVDYIVGGECYAR